MTFTSTTIRKLRALGLDQATFDAVLLIFEDAKEAKAKKPGNVADRAARGTRLAEDWALPAAWSEWAAAVGLRGAEISREATKFKNYWLNQPGAKGIKLKWDLTWQNWCLGMLERAGRVPLAPKGSTAIPAEGPEMFTDATWQAIAKRYKSTGQWNPAWGPGPGRMDCQMPDTYL